MVGTAHTRHAGAVFEVCNDHDVISRFELVRGDIGGGRLKDPAPALLVSLASQIYCSKALVSRLPMSCLVATAATQIPTRTCVHIAPLSHAKPSTNGATTVQYPRVMLDHSGQAL